MITREVTIWCDYHRDEDDACMEWQQANDWESRGGNQYYARRFVRDTYGYRHTKDGHDYCKKHAKTT